MDFTSTLISNKNIATDSPSATNTSSVSDSNTVTTTPNTASVTSTATSTSTSTSTSSTTPAIFISHKSNSTNNNNNNNNNNISNNNNTALSISPTSTLPINNNSNSQSNENSHVLGNNMDLNKIRRDSIAHSQGMGGVSWGSLTIGSWLRDEVMLRGLNNNSNNNNHSNNNNNIMENSIGPNYSTQSKVYNTNRNSISYRRLSTINKLNKPMKSENDDDDNNNNRNSDPHNNHPSDPYSNFPANSSDHSDILHLNSPPLSSNSTYLPYFETQFCRDYSCCGLSLPGLHDLLRHYEEAHIGGFGYNIGYLNGNHISYNNNSNSNYGVKKQNNYLKQQYSKQQQRNVVQEQLKSKNNDPRFLNKSNADNSNNNNNNNHVTRETIHDDSPSMPKIKNNLDNFSFNNDKNKDISMRNNQNLTTGTEINTNNRSSSDNNNNNNNNNNNSMMGTGMDMDLMNNDLLSMGFDPSSNHDISRIVPDPSTHDPTSNMGSTHRLRNSSIPSSIITNGPLNHGLGVIDADSHHDNGVVAGKEEVKEKDGSGDVDGDIVMDSNARSISNNNNNDVKNNIITNRSANNESFHNLKESVNSLDVSTGNNSHGFNNILMENSGDLNNLLVDSFSIQQMHFDNNTNMHDINNNSNNNNNDNNNDNDILGDISNNQPFMEDAIHNEASGMAHKDPLSSLHTNNNDGDMDNDDMNNDGNSMNFIDDPARRLYVMDHEEHKPFKCPVIGCEKTYKNQNGLKYHRLHGHQNQKLLENPDGTFTVLDPDSNEPYPEGMGYEKDKPYRCEVCGKRYKNLNGLKYHRGHSTH